MKRELGYFEIDGAFGGNQEWFTNVVMNIGGCGAATACDCCIYFAKSRRLLNLYPFRIDQLNKEDYKKFSQIMKPYIKPRVGGVKKLAWFIEGFKIIVATYGEKTTFLLREMWNTGFEEKGGLVTFHFTNERLSDTIKRLEQ